VNILLTNFAMTAPGGTERWTQTLAAEFKQLGHTVHLWTPHPGIESAALDDICVLHKRPPTTQRFDICLINHNKCLQSIHGNPSPKIFTSHGPHNTLELPIEGADAYVAISEEVQQVVNAHGFRATVIRNPIAPEFFDAPPPSPFVNFVLYLTKGNYPDFGLTLGQVCDNRGFYLDIIHSERYPSCAVAHRMAAADIVVTIGRGVLEALASGRNIIVADERTPNGPLADGFLLPEHIRPWRKRNFAGRTSHIEPSAVDLNSWFDMYDPAHYEPFHKYALDNHHASSIAKSYLKLAERTIANAS